MDTELLFIALPVLSIAMEIFPSYSYREDAWESSLTPCIMRD